MAGARQVTVPSAWGGSHFLEQAQAKPGISFAPPSTAWVGATGGGSNQGNQNQGYGGGSAPAPVYTAADGSKWGSAAEAARRNGEIGIAKAYSNFQNDLDVVYSQVGNRQDTLLRQIREAASGQRGTLETQRDIANQRLGAEEQGIQSEKKSGLRNIANQVRKQLQTGNVLLGTRGAGSSSAAELLPLALAEEQGQSRSDLLGQSNSQLAQVGLRKGEVEAQFQDNAQRLEQWKAEQEQAAMAEYDNLRTQIRRQQAGARREERVALANLAIDAANRLGSKLDQIQSQFSQATKELQNALKTQGPNLTPERITQPATTFSRESLKPGQVAGLNFGG